MTTPRAVDLTPAEAAALTHRELDRAGQALRTGDLNTALEGYISALGLALQLGPAPTEQALAAILQAARELALRHDAEGLSTLGPALVGLVGQVRQAFALPPTTIMDTWATLASDLGALIGQLGLALTIPAGHRAGMLDNARARATLLDEATDGRFALSRWLEEFDS
jgi:hypothetical protein